MPEVSKSAADRAGSRLARAADTDAEGNRKHSEVIDEWWRALHAEPLHWLSLSVQGRLDQAARGVVVGQRLKRKPQILSKLRRETIRLSQMQDVGGCRAILKDPSEITLAIRQITSRTVPWYEIKDIVDYRARERQSGYRAVHIIVVREGRQLEIQLRTLRQHAWAEGVERAATRSGYRLKDDEGPEEMLEFFRRASTAFWAADRGRPISTAMRAELRELFAKSQAHLPEGTAVHPATDPPAHIKPKELKTRLNQWLIVYDWRSARFVAWSDLETDAARAAAQYASFERKYSHEKGFEVVLLGANSPRTIEITHSHYFGRNPNDIDPHGFFAEALA